MRAKCLRYSILFIGAASFLISATGRATELKCYGEISQFMLSQFGEGYKKEENLVSENVSSTHLFMVTDKTPTINPSRYFFSPAKDNNRICLVLTAPVANEVDFSKSLFNGVPSNIVTRSGGQGANNLSIRYKWNDASNMYKPTICMRGDGLHKKSISCKKILSIFN